MRDPDTLQAATNLLHLVATVAVECCVAERKVRSSARVVLHADERKGPLIAQLIEAALDARAAGLEDIFESAAPRAELLVSIAQLMGSAANFVTNIDQETEPLSSLSKRLCDDSAGRVG